MSLGARIKKARKSLGLTQAQLAEKCGISRSYLADVERDSYNPSLDTLMRIAKALNTTPNYLTGIAQDMLGESYKTGLAGAVYEDNFGPSSQDKKDWRADIIPYNRGLRIPILGSIPAGTPVMAIENIEGYDYADVPNDKDYFFLRVKGNSMVNAHIYDGDLVLIRVQSTAQDGNIVACIVNGDEATLKRFYQRGDTVVLQPENSEYAPIIISVKEFENGYARIIGVAKEVKRKL